MLGRVCLYLHPQSSNMSLTYCCSVGAYTGIRVVGCTVVQTGMQGKASSAASLSIYPLLRCAALLLSHQPQTLNPSAHTLKPAGDGRCVHGASRPPGPHPGRTGARRTAGTVCTALYCLVCCMYCSVCCMHTSMTGKVLAQSGQCLFSQLVCAPCHSTDPVRLSVLAVQLNAAIIEGD